MGKDKNKAERKAGQVAFEQRQAARAIKVKPEKFSNDEIRVAASFALQTNPEQAAAHSTLSAKVIEKIAAGNFNPTYTQQNQIVSAARKLGWAPGGTK